MKPLEDKQLASFLELVNYLNMFSPHLARLTKPLQNLMPKDIVFTWTPQQEEALESIEKEISKTTVLSYFNPKMPITLQIDASTAGLGAALVQEQIPSKTLTGPETIL